MGSSRLVRAQSRLLGHTEVSVPCEGYRTPTLPWSPFAPQRDRRGNDVGFACAYLSGEPIACDAGVRLSDESKIMSASALRAYAATSVNGGGCRALVKQAPPHGLARFARGRSTQGRNTHRFNRQWGALNEPLYWCQSSRGGIDSSSSSHSRTFGIASCQWSRLPPALKNTLRTALVRYIP